MPTSLAKSSRSNREGASPPGSRSALESNVRFGSLLAGLQIELACADEIMESSLKRIFYMGVPR